MGGIEDAEMFDARRVAFGAFPATHDAVRPEWPAETVAWMLGSPTTATVCRVVDLGAGPEEGPCYHRTGIRGHRHRALGGYARHTDDVAGRSAEEGRHPHLGHGGRR